MSAVIAYKPRDVPPIYGWKYTGQPRSKWPVWLRNHYRGQLGADISHQHGRIAAAHMDNERITFWRWFDADKFDQLYQLAQLTTGAKQ